MNLFQPVRVGLIGCGTSSTAYLGHARKYDLLNFIACADVEFHRAETKAELYNIPQVLTVDELIAHEKVQMVLNLSPVRLRTQVGLDALRAGKHLYTEAPLAVYRAEVNELIAEAQQRQLLLGCAPDNFMSSALQAARQLIDEGVIGAPLCGTACIAGPGPEVWHPDPEVFYQHGGGPQWNTLPLTLTALIYLLGPIRRVSGIVRTLNVERTIVSDKKKGQRFPANVPTHLTGTLEFHSGTLITVLQSYDIIDHHLPPLELHGTLGSLSLPDPASFNGDLSLRLRGSAEWETLTPKFNRDISRGVGVADLAYAIVHHRPQRCHPEMAAHLVDACLAFAESSQQGTVIDLTTHCTPPKPLPADLPPYELDY